MPCLFAAYTSRLPEQFASEEMILMSEGLEEYEALPRLPVDVLAYQLVVLSRHDDPAYAAAITSSTWREEFGFSLHLELLETQLSRMCRSVRRSFRLLEDGQFYVRPPVVAYRASCRPLQDKLQTQIRRALTRHPWQFWL
jgi:hypothetical protein